MAENLVVKLSKRNRFEFKQITIVFLAIIVLQIIFSIVNRSMLTRYLTDYQNSYQINVTNEITHITESYLAQLTTDQSDSLNNKIILKRLFGFLKKSNNIVDYALIAGSGKQFHSMNDESSVYDFLIHPDTADFSDEKPNTSFLQSMKKIPADYFKTNREYIALQSDDRYVSIQPISVPGIFEGFLFLKFKINTSTVKREIIGSYTETTYIYLSIVLLGMLGLYYIATYTAVERDEVQEALIEEHEDNVKNQIVYEKESLFTKRIYHTHHKAEKVMGFIKEDLRQINKDNIEEIRYRVIKYSNFISRVIYDMKWYDPPLHTIRNSYFNTNINEIIQFIIDNIFNRITSANKMFEFHLHLDSSVPTIPINEFVVWEVLEPIMQNSIDHGGDTFINIDIYTQLNEFDDYIDLIIRDDGKGIPSELLEKNEDGISYIFLENVSTKKITGQNSGYGCYIAYTIATERCGWTVQVDNLQPKGCQFTFKIPIK